MKNSGTQINSEPKRRLSLLRLVYVIVIFIGLIYGVSLSFEGWQENKSRAEYGPWFAAYVDVTSTPTYAFEKLGLNTKSDVILSFIVSDAMDPCIPTWGGYYTMSEAAVSLDLDRRIARLQQQGGRIAISFGGALNSELALKCTDEKELFDAYKSVIEHYNINTIDLDLENQGLVDIDASKRRADVIAQLQKYYRDNEEDLSIWLTLPVSPQGMTKEGTDVITQMLSSGVDLSGVNVMTMDYGASRDQEDSMFEASKIALIESHRQLGVLYKQAGISLSSNSLWQKIGATPMIGQNDFLEEIFTLEDAKMLNLFAYNQGAGRMSMWSANRDIPCGENYVNVKVVSDACSGVSYPQFAFTKSLSAGFDGDLMQNAKLLTVEDSEINYQVVDNPKKSPYQVWKETGAYPRGTKIVWRGNVYEAKWWTRGDLPDNPVLQLWETSWKLIGPVLPGEKPIQPPTLPVGTYQNWSGTVIYNAGNRVLFDGVPFQAKWWNQGESPAAAASNPDNSPWLSLTQEQVEKILETHGRL